MAEGSKKFMSATAELLLMERNEAQEAQRSAEARAAAAERKYEDLVEALRPLFETIKKMEKPASEISAILAGFRTEDQTERGG